MKTYTLGKGFVSDHLPYGKILDRLTADNVKNILQKYISKGDVIVNCIGRTGTPNVDWCEDNKFSTAFGNVIIPLLVAEACSDLKVHLIQISSGCIYYDRTNLREDDVANPKSYYSKTKYASDLLIGDLPHVTNLRIRMPISSKDHPRNLINKLIQYDKVIDEPNSMTFMDDLVRSVEFFIKNRSHLNGTYHVVNPTPTSAATIMFEYQKYNPKHSFEVIDLDELESLVTAERSNCTLDTTKLTIAGFTMTPTNEALRECMRVYCK